MISLTKKTATPNGITVKKIYKTPQQLSLQKMYQSYWLC